MTKRTTEKPVKKFGVSIIQMSSRSYVHLLGEIVDPWSLTKAQLIDALGECCCRVIRHPDYDDFFYINEESLNNETFTLEQRNGEWYWRWIQFLSKPYIRKGGPFTTEAEAIAKAREALTKAQNENEGAGCLPQSLPETAYNGNQT